jgi:hypothetical protein
MRQVTIAATLAIAALFAAAPASAEHVMGGPVTKNGQCFKASKGMDNGTFGSWGACAAPAGNAAATTTRRRHS